MMSRAYIEENDVIGRYVDGALSLAEVKQFEEAYFHDPELAAMVEAEQVLRATLIADAGTTPRAPSAPIRPASLWRLAAAFAAVALLFSTVFYVQRVGQLTRDRQGLAADLTAMRLPSLAGIDARLTQSRSGPDTIPDIRLPIPAAMDEALVLEIPPPQRAFTRVELKLDLDGRNIWRTGWQSPRLERHALHLTLPATYVQPGSYTAYLTYFGETAEPISVEYVFDTYIAAR